MRWYGLPLAAAIALLANAVVLTRVAHNRTGEPDAVVTLTERELPPAWRSTSEEDSGVALQLHLTRGLFLFLEGEDAGGAPALDAAALESLGFDVRLPLDPEEANLASRRELPRRAFAVLESDGARWTAWKARLERRLAALDGEIASGKETIGGAKRLRESAASQLAFGSRLFIVDVGLDPAALRRRYPDRRVHFILPALVTPHLVVADRKPTCRPPECHLGGSVSLLVSEVNVPRRLQAALPWAGARGDAPPRYQVDLTVGRGHEPWITAVRPIAAAE